MAGFFVAKRSVVERSRLSGSGYKILLEILVRGSPEGVVEVPYVFRDRRAGESKLGLRVVARDLAQLMRLYLWRLRHPLSGPRRWGCEPRGGSPGA
jgi:dolichol-phosphate mannosyltransferase